MTDASGDPPAATAYRDGQPAGYVLSTEQVVGSVGYSGKPIDVLVGLDLDGRIVGAHLRHHQEPILVIGVPEAALKTFVADFAGTDIAAPTAVRDAVDPSSDLPDAISGATVSSAVIGDSILRAARAVARSRGLLGAPADAARLDRESFSPASWGELVADGSLAHRRVPQADVAVLFGPGVADQATEDPDSLFIEIYAGLATPPRVGENLLGKRAFNELVAGLGVADQAIVVAANGRHSFKGTAYVRSGVFDRLQVAQGERTIRLTRDDYRLVERLRAEGAPEFREIALFILRGDSGFDPLAPWRLELLVERETAGGALLRRTLALPVELPARYRIEPAGAAADTDQDPLVGAFAAGPDGEELWVRIWRERRVDVALLGALLTVLSGILVFQDAVVVRDARRHRIVRNVFLTVVLVWLGWIVGGQLSVVNVLTFFGALLTDFQWSFFLLDPISFMLWGFVAVTLLFWGRGVFCGWLCPFGALQELLNHGARALRVPQIQVPFGLHERLWPIKYVIFLGLFALSLHSSNLAVAAAEVEPFKTAIALHFARAWPFVAYTAALLVAGLFIERFFCRYLCPLGAALAIPARLRMFDWLHRRHQCGRSCHNCAVACTVQAIHPDGQINPNECIYCLNCQAMYFDATVCPPLIAERKKTGHWSPPPSTAGGAGSRD